MFSKIIVALDDLPESQRALCTAIDLARSLGAALVTVSVLGDPPSYASFAIVVDPEVPALMKENRRRVQTELYEKAALLAEEHGVPATSAIIDGPEAQAMLRFLGDEKADLLVIRLHKHDSYLSRLWSSVYDFAQVAPCSVLGVH